MAFKLVVAGVGIVFVDALITQEWLMMLGCAINTIGIFFYMWKIYIIAKLTVRKELDVWAKSMIFAFVSLLV